MKKMLFLSFCTFAVAIALGTAATGGWKDLGERLKNKGCEKACNETYSRCMEKASRVVDREKQGELEAEVKDTAKEEACQAARDECINNC